MCKRIWRHIPRWMLGGVLYGLLEVLWRGHTHWTMMVLAAVLCVPLDVANEHFPWALPLWVQAILGGLTITAGELLAGLVLNVWLGLGIWDYSGQWGNVLGQICPLYTALWCLLAGPVIVLFGWIALFMGYIYSPFPFLPVPCFKHLRSRKEFGLVRVVVSHS